MNKLKVMLVNLSKKNVFFRHLLRGCIFVKNRMIYLFFYIRPVKKKRVLFEAFMGRKYVDSPKAMYEYMLTSDEYQDFEFVWFFKDPSKYKHLEKNRNTKVLKYGSAAYYRFYATSKYWVTNSRVPDTIVKKKNQVYIQCWHGTPLKRLGFDIEVKGGNAMNSLKDIRYKYQVDSKKYSYMVSPSKFCTEKFISAFNLRKVGKEHIVIEKGYPRNDFLINYKKSDVERVKKELNLPKDKKIILYAPTWRDNQHTSGIGYTYKTEVDFDYLREQLSDEYIILFRAHYFVANSFDFKKYEGFIYNVSDYDDINELYILGDLLITDYSSVFFDYSILKRPMIFYMYDLEEYQHELRDFYFDIKELPGPIVEKEKDLVKAIKEMEHFKYDKKYEDFNNKYTYLDDGNASKRVVKELIKED